MPQYQFSFYGKDENDVSIAVTDEIEDVRDRLLEGIWFEIVSQYDSSFRCACRRIEILAFDRAYVQPQE
jgi:hypothetical protein